jgi:probable phosphoglycerate mutase
MLHHEGVAGAETNAEFAERIYAVMAEIPSCTAEYIVIVTHEFALTYIITAWLELPWESAGYASFASKPGNITTLGEDAFSDNRQIATLADITHLNH